MGTLTILPLSDIHFIQKFEIVFLGFIFSVAQSWKIDIIHEANYPSFIKQLNLKSAKVTDDTWTFLACTTEFEGKAALYAPCVVLLQNCVSADIDI